jgi:TolA-binding protein
MTQELCRKLAARGQFVPDIAVAGGFSSEDHIFKVLAMGSPFTKAVCMGRALMIPGMVGKNTVKSLPLAYIATDQLPQAKEALQQLLSKYAQYEYLPHAIHEIVEGAKPLLKLPQVRQLFQDMVTAQPGGSQALWLKMGMAIASVHLAEDEAVDAVLQDIIAQHAQDNRAAEALNHIGWAYRKLQRYNEALTIYQYVVDNWPQKDRVVFAQQSIAICQVRLGDRQAADEALDVMLQKYGKDGNTSKLLAWSVYEYLQAGETEGACKVFDLVLQTYPDAPETIEALLSLATAVIQGDDRDRIEPTVQTLLTRFAPTDAKASALRTVANMLAWKCIDYANQPLEEQNLPGIYNRSLLAIANYILTTWPRSDRAMWAERDLATAAIQRDDDPNAEVAISRLITDYADREDAPAALNFVADCCLELRRHDKADAVYEHLVKKYPAYEQILLAKAGLGAVEIYRGNDAGAEAIFQEVATEHANHPKLPKATVLIAEAYFLRSSDDLRQGNRERANSHLREAISKANAVTAAPNSIWPEMDQVVARAFHIAGLSSRRLGEFENAAGYLHIVVERFPDYDYISDASYALGLCSNLAKQYQEAVKYLDKSLQQWPDHKFAREARSARLNAYNGLYQTGAISLNDAIAATSVEFMVGSRQSQSRPHMLVTPDGVVGPVTLSGETQEGVRK